MTDPWRCPTLMNGSSLTRLSYHTAPVFVKFVNDDNDEDDPYPGNGDQENTPVTSPITRKTAPKVKPLQVVNTNLCSSYIRKVKGIKRAVIDLESDKLDSDEVKEEEKLSKNSQKTTTTRPAKNTKQTAKTTETTIHKKKHTPPSSTIALQSSPPSPTKPKPKNRSKLGHANQRLPSPPPLANGSYKSWEL
jgi:hypothetical protein